MPAKSALTPTAGSPSASRPARISRRLRRRRRARARRDRPRKERDGTKQRADGERRKTEQDGEVAEGPRFQRGDWVKVGRHLGQVVKVEGSGNRTRLVVESASDLKRRTVDPRRQRVRRVEDR